MYNRYGTTSDMIIQKIADNGTDKLVAIDSEGIYLTTSDRLDRNMADVNRYGVSRETCYQRLVQLGLDPHALFNANQHLIKTDRAAKMNAKKLNPIKASKRTS